MNRQLIKKIEALLFAWGDALSYQKIASLLDVDNQTLKDAVAQMKQNYQTGPHGIQLIEVNQSLQLASKQEFADTVEQLFKTERSRGLSNSLLEVLAIVAYRQPITKLEIEAIRGVGSDRSLQSLIELDFVAVAGKLEQIGRPNLYGTTPLFLKKFGLKTLRDLPPIESFEDLELALIDGEQYGKDKEQIEHD